MLKQAIRASGLAVASAGLASLAGSGVAYLLEPKRGRRRAAQRRRVRRLLGMARAIRSAAAHELHRDTDKLSRQFERASAWVKVAKQLLSPKQEQSVGVPLATAGLGLTLGVGIMYFLDSQQGAQRRGSAQARLLGAMQSLNEHARKLLGRNTIADAALVDNVRTVVRCVSTHASSISVHAHQGRITVHGKVPAEEIPKLLHCIAAVRDAQSVCNDLRPIYAAGADSEAQDPRAASQAH